MSAHIGSRFRTQNVDWQARLQGAQLASFKARAMAFIIDGLLIGALLGLLRYLPGAADLSAGKTMSISLEFGGAVGFLATILYFGLATWLGNGATPGKRLMGIRVVSIVHPHLTLWHCIERALGYTASSLEAGFGFLQYFKHPNHQTVHDRIAETIVVTRRRKTNQRAVPAVGA